MEKIIYAVFDSEEAAFKGQQKLYELDATDDISLGESVVITKDETGKAVLKNVKGEDDLTYTATGALTGSLIGILGGPIGVLLGAAFGSLFGATGDLIHSDHTSEYVDKISQSIPDGKTALIAHVEEEWTTPLDTSFADLNAKMTRLDADKAFDELVNDHLDELNKEVDELDREFDAAVGDAKESIGKKRDELRASRDKFVASIKEKTTKQKDQYESWVSKLKGKASKWKADVQSSIDEKKKERIEKQIAEQEQKLAELKEKLDA